MDQNNIHATLEDSLKRFSSDDDLCSDQPLLDDDLYESGLYQQKTFRRLREYALPSYPILTILLFALSLALLGVTFLTGDLNRACLKRMTGWCKLLHRCIEAEQ